MKPRVSLLFLALASLPNAGDAQFTRDINSVEAAKLLSVETVSRVAVGVPFYVPSYSLCYIDGKLKVAANEMIAEESEYLVNLRAYRNLEGSIDLTIEKGKRQDHKDLMEFVYHFSKYRICRFSDAGSVREPNDVQYITINSINGFNSMSLLMRDLLRPTSIVEGSIASEQSDDELETVDGAIFQWDISESSDEITDQPAVFVSTFASEKVGTIGLSWHPHVTLRCMRNTTAIVISVEDFQVEDRIAVSYRIDGGAAVSGAWRVASNRKAVGLWNGGESIPLLRKLYSGDSVTFRVEGDDDLYTFSVPLVGSRGGIEKIATACNWELS